MLRLSRHSKALSIISAPDRRARLNLRRGPSELMGACEAPWPPTLFDNCPTQLTT